MALSLTGSALAKWGFSEWVESSVQSNELYDPPVLNGANDAIVDVEGRELVNFSGIGILGWQREPDVLANFTAAAAEYGLVTGGSRMTAGVSHPHRDLESLLCEITGKERALTFASGLLANFGFVNAMSARFSFAGGVGVDNSDMVFVLDRSSHWSMWKAAEKFNLGRNLLTFRHNDTDHLRKVLEKVRGRRVVVGFEVVYSDDGTVAPVGEILDLCEEFNAVSYVDDATGFMVYGNSQRRFAQEYEDLRRVTFLMMSFAKSVGLEGGALVGPADAMQAFEMLSGYSIFTAAIQPPTASAIAYVLRRMLQNPTVINDYLDRVDWLRTQLTRIGCTINATPSYVTSIVIGSDEVAAQLRVDFAERGYLVPIFRYPAMKKNHAVIRLLLNARSSREHLDGFIETLAELKRKYGF
ncbi:aminotransferase class I/II-fold pyridoxal phosphate-dependent enzyme [Amycolatopsis panacis]|uniref:8-amino-7-oxononanoate synthase n=1 Tax=Amycolatopsis panacis TaxID=2340917 RepID=A0A419HWD6_9PSEU|nr:pyridoxal phosphate-dependent aminotransferase family protein [Amycolatopsis panacis]RJQ81298.1 pyridoxal phosphate-dependent aminotransferase family protein [Amycolatopsis panacis]